VIRLKVVPDGTAVGDDVVKVAVTVWLEFIVTAQEVGVGLVQSPAQPPKAEPAAGFAIKITTVPAL
jgi:hypothetical protein